MPGFVPPPTWQKNVAPNAAGSRAALAALAARSAGMNAANGVGVKNFGPGVSNPGGYTLKQSVGLGKGNSRGPNWPALFGGAAAPQADPPANAGASTSPAGSVPPLPGNYQQIFNNILQTALGLYNSPNPAANDLLSPAQLMSGISSSFIDPNQVGTDAGLGYDALLSQLNRNYSTTQSQNTQDLADIKSWFKQAANTQASGAAQNAKDFAAQLSGSQDAAKAFMDALGGSANPGAAGIANAASIANAGLLAQNNATTTFDNNMKGIVGLDQAQQLANEQTAGANRLQTIMDNIAQTQGQKSAAVAQAKDNAMQTLFGQKMSAAQLKANLVGNLFNEQSGLRQEKLNELGGLANTVMGTALAGPEIQGAELGNQNAAATVAGRVISNQGIAKEVASLGGAGNADISQANPGTRQQIQSIFQGRFLNPDGTLKMAPSAIPAMIVSELRSVQGWKNNSALQAFAKGLYRDLVTPNRVAAYNKAHAKK